LSLDKKKKKKGKKNEFAEKAACAERVAKVMP
jgi:hypothetical protein